MTTTRPEPPVVDPAEVQRLVVQLTALEAQNPRAFAESLADNIMEPDPAETLAFRSEELVAKSLVAARYLIDNTNSVMASRRRGTDLHKRTELFRNAVGRERRLLQSILDGMRARDGVLPTAPNPRGRAMRRLVNENLVGDVPKGRFRELVIEETENDKAKRAAAKEARKKARKAVRDATGTPRRAR